MLLGKSLDVAALGGVLDVHLLAADVLLGDRHGDLLLADLGPGSLAAHRHPLHRDLLVAGRDLHALAVGAHALADVDGAGLALAGAGPELLLAPLHPKLVLVGQVVAAALGDALVVGVVLAELARLGVAHGHARADRAGVRGAGGASAGVPVVSAVGTAVLGGAAGSTQAVVGADLVLVLGRDLPVVIEGGSVLGGLLVRRYRDGAGRLIGGGDLHRDEGALGAQEAHLHADVLRLIVLVEEQVVYLADLGSCVVVDGVARVLIFYGSKPVAAVLHWCPPLWDAFTSLASPRNREL